MIIIKIPYIYRHMYILLMIMVLILRDLNKCYLQSHIYIILNIILSLYLHFRMITRNINGIVKTMDNPMDGKNALLIPIQ